MSMLCVLAQLWYRPFKPSLARMGFRVACEVLAREVPSLQIDGRAYNMPCHALDTCGCRKKYRRAVHRILTSPCLLRCRCCAAAPVASIELSKEEEELFDDDDLDDDELDEIERGLQGVAVS